MQPGYITPQVWRNIQQFNYSAVVIDRVQKLERYQYLREQENCSRAGAALAVGVSYRTINRWRQALLTQGLRGLEPKSKRPKHRRQRQWTRQHVLLVRKLRHQYPTWSKRKIWKVLTREGHINFSISTVGRILHHLRRRGQILPASYYLSGRIKPCRRRTFTGHAQRWQPDQQTRTPGEMVQVDHMTFSRDGITLKDFKAICPLTSLGTVKVYSRATAGTATDFLKTMLRELPFRVRSIQVDGGSEFMAGFERACQALGIELRVLPPRSPKLNGYVERFNGTARAEFYSQYEGDLTATALNREMAEWVHHYNHYRPHDSRNLETPMAYYQAMPQTA